MFPASLQRVETGIAERSGVLLTDREREVLGMVASGRGTTWIAAELGVAPSTVESHVRHTLEELGARNP